MDFTASGAANDFFHTFSNFISGKNILSNVFSYVAVGALILLLLIILPFVVRILWQSTQMHLIILQKTKKGEMPGASVRNSAHGKGHEEGGLAYAKV